MHDNAEVLLTSIVESQQLLDATADQQQQQQDASEQPPGAQQQQHHILSNGHQPQDGYQDWPPQQQQQYRRSSANGGAYDRVSANGNSSYQQQRSADTAALAAMLAAVKTKLLVLSRPISDFSSCRREWVLKLGKAIATGFMHYAAGMTALSTCFAFSAAGPYGRMGSGIGKILQHTTSRMLPRAAKRHLHKEQRCTAPCVRHQQECSHIQWLRCICSTPAGMVKASAHTAVPLGSAQYPCGQNGALPALCCDPLP